MNPLQLGNYFLDKQIRESLTTVQQTIEEEIPNDESSMKYSLKTLLIIFQIHSSLNLILQKWNVSISIY